LHITPAFKSEQQQQQQLQCCSTNEVAKRNAQRLINSAFGFANKLPNSPLDAFSNGRRVASAVDVSNSVPLSGVQRQCFMLLSVAPQATKGVGNAH